MVTLSMMLPAFPVKPYRSLINRSLAIDTLLAR